MMKTRFVLPAHSTKVPVDMELAASFKMKVLVKFVYCIAKQQDPHQWICWYTVQAENRFHWSLYSKEEMKNRFYYAHTSDDMVRFVIETYSKTHIARKID